MTEKDELFFRSVVDAYHACHESLRDTAKAMQLSRTKVRKILITMGALESDITERALLLREKGYGRDEIADKRYEDETAYNRNIYQQENDYQKKWNIAEAMAQYGDFSGYKALGLSDDQIKNAKCKVLRPRK